MSTQPPYNETELRLRLQTGDEEAFTQIVHHYYPRLLPFILKITKTKHTAEEILQEVFLRLWQKRGEMERIEYLRSWLFRIAGNLALTWLKRASLEGRILHQLQQKATEEENPVEEYFDYRQSNAQLKAAVEQLPEQQRFVFKLRREEGLSNDEIARQLNLSPNTVKNHLAKALQTLRKIIGDKNLILFGLSILFK